MPPLLSLPSLSLPPPPLVQPHFQCFDAWDRVPGQHGVLQQKGPVEGADWGLFAVWVENGCAPPRRAVKNDLFQSGPLVASPAAQGYAPLR